MSKFEYALIYNNQALDEYGFTTELMSKGHYYPSKKSMDFVDKLFSNNKLCSAVREKYWINPYNSRTFASIFARIYAVYVENPQYFGNEPHIPVLSAILSANRTIMHFHKEDEDPYSRVPKALVEAILDQFHEAIYPESLTLISLKKRVSTPTPRNLDNPWAKTFGWI